ncbi:MAG: IPT/TIG domain-containing protein [Patescibacteria group bacterium]
MDIKKLFCFLVLLLAFAFPLNVLAGKDAYVGTADVTSTSFGRKIGILNIITDTGFNTTQGVVTIGGARATVNEWTNSHIIALVPDTVEGNARVIVTTANNILMDAGVVTINPKIYAPTNDIYFGARMTLLGEGFGSVMGKLINIDNSSDVGSIVSWSDTQIVLDILQNGSLNFGSNRLQIISQPNSLYSSYFNLDVKKSICTLNDWSCISWGTCSLNGTQTRTCSKTSNCEGGVSSPVTTQSCTYTPLCTINDYSCSGWAICSQSESQTRTCNKISNCDGGVLSPTNTQSCSYIVPVQETQEASGSFKLILPKNREQGVVSGDKISVDYYGSDIITEAYLNSTKLNLKVEWFNILSYLPPIINNQVVSFLIPFDSTDGDIIVHTTNGKSKNIGNIKIYSPQVDCIYYGNAYYWEQKGECACKWGYKWNSNKTACIEDIKETDNLGPTNDTDNDGVSNDKDFYPTKKSEVITTHYSFYYKLLDGNQGAYVSFNINVPNDLYLYYQNQNHLFSENYNNITSFITYDDLVITEIANQIAEYKRSQGLNPITLAYQLVGEVMYTDDKFSIRGWDEYPKYPVETIVDRKGDCEDTTFLMTSLLKALDLSIPMLVRFDNHIGVASVVPKDVIDTVIKRWGVDFMWEFNKYLKEKNPNDYYGLIYLETTGNAYWVPGYMPEELRHKNYKIHVLDEYKRVKNVSKIENITIVDSNLIKRVKGKILLQVESHGEAWYVNPTDGKRYYMKNGVIAYQMMRQFGLGITNANLARVPQKGDNKTYPSALNHIKGRILLQVEAYGEAWYVNPKTGYMYYMKDGEAAYNLMRYHSLGITNKDLEKIPEGSL